MEFHSQEEKQNLTGEATLDGVGLDEDEDAAGLGRAGHGGSLLGRRMRDRVDHNGSGPLKAMRSRVQACSTTRIEAAAGTRSRAASTAA